MCILVGGKKLHHGKSTVYVDLETDDPASDTTLILKGEVVPDPRALAITVELGLLWR